MAAGQFPDEAPPHWSIAFAVDDAEVSAEKASELGGTVLVAPLDAGPTRIAVVSDPAGATSTVSRYYPEAL